jgi:flagellar hook-associated protein 1 FlgK
MSLNGALQIGRSALAASQAAIQVAGNNMANAATPGFNRRSIHLAAVRDEIAGRNQFIGQGVDLRRVRREVDTALQSRLRDAVSQEHATLIDQRFLTALETIQNELSGNDLSSVLSEFFNSFSELANNPEDHAIRSVVVQQGVSVAGRIADMRRDYGTAQEEIDRSLGVSVLSVNDLLDRIAALNHEVALTEQGVHEAAALRDQRDALIDELSQYLEVSVIEQPTGAIDILVGSVPIILAGESRGIEARFETEDDVISVSIRVAADGTTLDVESGRIGALMRQRQDHIQPAIDTIDAFAAQLVFQVNRLHSQGQGRSGFAALTALNGVDDTTVPLNDAAAGLPFTVENGSFFIHVTHAAGGLRTSHRIDVNGAATSLDDLVNEINAVVAVPNVTASVGAGGQLVLTASAGYEISFSDDTSGALAALGLNSFFTGEDAATIGVSALVQDNPAYLAAGAGHVAGSNGTALAIAELQNVALNELGGLSLREYWQNSVNQLAVRTDAANAAVESSILVRENLAAQVQAVSGVSLDEESISLLTYQRQFQAAARFIATIDEAMQILLSIA